MNAQRKKIIMTEINYWKQHKLLPEHYCDFLITLYTEGNHEQEGTTTITDAVLSKEKKRVSVRAILIQLSYILIAFAVLAASFGLWSLFFEGQTMLLVAFLIVNCLLWLLLGRMLKLLYFTISGVAGLVLLVFFIMSMVF